MTTEYQSGIVAEANSDAIFVTFNATAKQSSVTNIRQVLATVPELERGYRERFKHADLHITVAIGSTFWDRYYPHRRPAELTSFPALDEGGLSAPETLVDLLLHIRSERHDLNYEVANQLAALLGNSVELVEEVHGFRYMDNRDLTGFVDGTENPQGEHRAEVAVVGEEDSGFAGGSYIHLQRYEHDMLAWNAIAVKQQEDIVGRTKIDNVEYASADKPLFSHTKRTSLKDSGGKSIEILRHSMPYGDLNRRGLLFAAFGRSPEPFALMLKSMIQGDGTGYSDHLLKYTQAVTGQVFFAPSVPLLKSLNEPG
ncbi:MAG: Dyp-type peroxidase [Amphritea sp.]